MRWIVVFSALVLGAVACSQDAPVSTGTDRPVETAPVAAPTGGEPAAVTTTTAALPDPGAAPGVVVWVHDREPPDLHFDDPLNGTDLAGWVQQGLLEGLFGVDSTLGWYPELVAGEPRVTRQNDGKVVIEYQLRDGLTWSDGEPLTADDVAYTNDIILEGCETEGDGSIIDGTDEGCEYSMGSRIGYELVTGFEVTSPTTFTVTFAAFFAGWRDLYPNVFARHAYGADAFAVNGNLRQWRSEAGVLPSSGPLVFREWVVGEHLDLGPNPGYHGSVSPEAVNTGPVTVEGVRVVFVGSQETRVAMLGQGAGHLVMTQLDPALAELTAAEQFTVATRPGGVWEHVGLNLLNPHLARPQVREAIAYAVDKGEIVASVYAPILGPVLPEAGVGNTYRMPMQPGYEDHQEGYDGNDVAGAEAALAAAGYTRGADGVWVHPEDGRLTLRAGTTAGNDLREGQLELVRAQLGRAGIEVTIESFPGGLFFDQGPFSPESLAASASGGSSGDPGLWDMAVWSWATAPWPGGVTGIYRQRSDSNPYGFSNPAFDKNAADCEAVLDDAERSGCYNDLDTYATTLAKGDDGLFVIPLTQKPRYYGYASSVLASVGVAPDLARGGPLVNAGDLAFRS